MGILKWYLVYRVATRGRRRRRAEARERELLLTLFDVADADSSLVEICEECGEVVGDHLVDDEELLCPKPAIPTSFITLARAFSKKLKFL